MATSLAVKTNVVVSGEQLLGSAFKTVSDRLRKLEQADGNTRLLKLIFGEVFSLHAEVVRARQRAQAEADEWRAHWQTNHQLLRQQLALLAQLRNQSRQQVAAGKAEEPDGILKVLEDVPTLGDWIKIGKALALPVSLSAGYQGTLRDMAIREGARPAAVEPKINDKVGAIVDATGMERNEAATLIKELQSTGMGLDKALQHSLLTAKLVVGQKASTEDAAQLVSSLLGNPNIRSAGDLEKALEFVVLQRRKDGGEIPGSLSSAQSTALNRYLADKNTRVGGILDQDLEARRASSQQKWIEAGNAFSDALGGLGDALRPLTDLVADGLTATAKFYSALPDEGKIGIAGAALGGSLLAHKLMKRKAANEEAAAKQPSNAASQASEKPAVNAQAKPKPGGKRKSKPKGGPSLQEPPIAASKKPVMRVEVGKRKSMSGTYDAPMASFAGSPSPYAASRAPTAHARSMSASRSPGRGGSQAAMVALDTLTNATTQDEKAEGYGQAIGGLIGSVGASLIPFIGPVIGPTLGGMVGSAVGGWVGKTFFGSATEPAASRPPVPAAPVEAAAQPQPVTQNFTYSPNMPITVQGAVTDLAQFTQMLEATVRRQFEEMMRMATQRQMADPTHMIA